MPDMLVKLYDIPELAPALALQREMGITIRRGMPPEKFLALDWIGQHFSQYWVSEADVAFAAHPPTVFLAHRGDQVLGFACYDTARKNFFGPTGVDEAERGQGIGTALLLAALHAYARGRLYVRHHRLGRAGQLLRESGGRRGHPGLGTAWQLPRHAGHAQHIQRGRAG